MVHYSWDDVKRGEGVCSHLALGASELIQKCRLSHAGEAHQGDGGVPRFLHGVPLTAPARGSPALLLLHLEAGYLGLQKTYVALGLLVVLGLEDLLLDRLDLLIDGKRHKFT